MNVSLPQAIEIHAKALKYRFGNRAVLLAEERQRLRPLKIDPQGGFQVKTLLPQSVLVFIVPPSWEELQRRLEARGSETKAQLKTRLETAKHELELVGEYDHVVQNDDVPRAVGELVALIDSYADQQEV